MIKEGVYTIIVSPILDQYDQYGKNYKEVIGPYEDTHIYRWYYENERLENALSREPAENSTLTVEDRLNLMKCGKAIYARVIKDDDGNAKALIFNVIIIKNS